MNASKVISLLSRAAAVGGVAALAGFALNLLAIELFSAAVGLFVVLLIASDYAPRRGYGFDVNVTPASGLKLGHPLRLAA